MIVYSGMKEDFKTALENKGKKLIITDSVSGVNKMVRAYSLDATIYGVKVVSIIQLATELFLSYRIRKRQVFNFL